MERVIDISNVSKKFRSTLALDDVSFRVPRGVVFALLGENGAGKTTLIRTMLGLEKQDSGTLKLLGMDPVKNGLAIRRCTGYVSDSPALYRWMTVSQIARFTASFYDAGFLEAFGKLASNFDLELDQKIKNLSKGGQAKVALALSMAHQPELLILDEPTSGLDAIVRRHFLESMIDVAAEGRTVLLSSHQISEVERVADWVGVIRKGKLVACDELASLKARFERWIVTMHSENLDFDSSIIGNLVSHESKGRKRQQLMLFDVKPGLTDYIRSQPEVSDVEVQCASLEEVFVSLMKFKVTRPSTMLVSADGLDSPAMSAVNLAAEVCDE
jgi:ABC-2 type transport system ATP-binding protein